MQVIVLGAGLAGLAATERLLDVGCEVVVVDSFPVPGGRTASFEARVPVAGLEPGDVVEHGLHAWFQHYHALYGLMERAAVPKPAFKGHGIYLWNPEHGHTVIEGGPLFWLANALRLPETMRGPRRDALLAYARLIRMLNRAVHAEARTDAGCALELLRSHGVPKPAIENVFRPCMFSLTSLPLEELSAFELLRWMSHILPDPRIRALDAGTTEALTAPLVAYLERRGARFHFGVEVQRLCLDERGRVQLQLAQAPDRTGVRHLLVWGFQPDPVPDTTRCEAVVSALPWERLLEVAHGDPQLETLEAWRNMRQLRNVHPMTIRLWFERPIASAADRYILCAGTLFDVMRPTPEPARGEGIRLMDVLIENIESHLPEFAYTGERFVQEAEPARPIETRVLADLERMYPGQIAGNRVLRRFIHTREGIVACRTGVWPKRPPQYIGLDKFVIAGDWTRQPWGVCMEGAVRAGQLAAQALLDKCAHTPAPWPFRQLLYSARSVFQR